MTTLIRHYKYDLLSVWLMNIKVLSVVMMDDG